MTSVETHVVKKYSNRKLYDTFTKKYVTLDVIAELLRNGDEVRVVDRNTGDDITAVTLSQILLDMERQRRSTIPEPLLVDMVKERGEQLISMLRASLSLPRDTVRRTLGTGAQSLENRVDEALTVGLRNLNIASFEEVAALQQRVDELAARVEELGAQLGSPRSRRRGAARG
jgi:polyhydroxyalkanoate synthesis repressor PhaR